VKIDEVTKENMMEVQWRGGAITWEPEKNLWNDVPQVVVAFYQEGDHNAVLTAEKGKRNKGSL